MYFLLECPPFMLISFGENKKLSCAQGREPLLLLNFVCLGEKAECIFLKTKLQNNLLILEQTYIFIFFA